MNVGISELEEQRYTELQAMALDYARSGTTELLGRMMAAGMPLNLCDAKGNSLLMLAAYHGHLSAVHMLLELGADPNRRNDRNQTPLGGVAFKGYTEIAELLLDHGAGIDSDNGGGLTPLMFASMFGREAMVECLTRRGASLQQRNRLGLTAKSVMWLSHWFGRMFRVRGKRRQILAKP